MKQSKFSNGLYFYGLTLLNTVLERDPKEILKKSFNAILKINQPDIRRRHLHNIKQIHKMCTQQTKAFSERKKTLTL